jgi:hypothetical protein
MIKSWFVAVVLLAAVALFFVGARRATKPAEEITPKKVLAGFEPPLLDLGSIRQSQIVQTNVRIFNYSTNPLTISLVQVGCECTVLATNYIGRIVDPNHEIDIPIIYHSDSRAGYSESTVLFILESPTTNYRAQAKIKSHIEAEFFLERNSFDFGVLHPGQSSTQTTVIRPGRLAAPPLMQTQASFGVFKALVLDEQNAKNRSTGSTLTVTFTAEPTSQRTVFSTIVHLPTRSSRVPMVEVPVRAVVAPAIEVFPQTLVLAPGDPTRESGLTVRTISPSRIARAFTRSARQTNEISLRRAGGGDTGWENAHRFYVTNLELAESEQLNIQIEIQSAAGQTEAWPASVKITRLEQTPSTQNANEN